ncbi:AMP-binding protein [Methanobrevibacter filiformis]|uniref:Long-chain-fatty-acid--CoA ligase n=1 Tax=Methanobrevibacter filiformis TaxID=55758 RepID=A0A162F9T8_9EURY|nr:AMP-binding protein [Methanobrevibacter filiformis]KZX10015.1 long-chain-fatty-acid--CoA ligase [Methanobrevibacter filiformis]
MENLNDFILKPARDDLDCNRPWIKYYSENTFPNIEYPDKNMYQMIEFIGENRPNNEALEFLGLNISYNELISLIDQCAKALIHLGLGVGDKITICLPNIPQTVIAFYAVNKIGAVSNMIHPLSAPKEIEYYLTLTDSKFVLTTDFAFENFVNLNNVDLKRIIVCKIQDYLSSAKRAGFWLFSGRKIPKIPKNDNIIMWKDLLKLGKQSNTYKFHIAQKDDPAVILYTGGTTGKQKGVVLSNLNFNALALQTGSQVKVELNDTMMCIMPFFHGFGLGVSMHTTLVFGAKAILVPKFNTEEFAKTFNKYKPNFIAGVPTLFAALVNTKQMKKTDFSCLKGIFSGADTLPNEIKVNFENFIHEKGAKVNIREGYGLTETVTASCLTPPDEYRHGSIGIPFPDTLYQICHPGTQEPCALDEEGEICISGPTVMLEYYKEKEETDIVLQKHSDGYLWIHTGDFGSMDNDGFVYFKQRIKRIIKSSGYSVFPSQIENVLIEDDTVANCCVVGVPDPYQMEKIRAYIILEDGCSPSKELEHKLLKRCKEYLSKWSVPQDFVFRDELPLTQIGKISYVDLEKEILDEIND